MGSVKCCCFLLMCMKGKRKGLVELKSSYSVLGERERERGQRQGELAGSESG